MRILFLVGRESSYSRNAVLLRALQRLGEVEIISGGIRGSLIWRSLRAGARAFPRLLAGRYDLIFVGFYGHLLMLPAGLLGRAPVLFDAFVSNYDTLCFDRGRFAPDSLPGRLALGLDQASCRLADRVLLDTPRHQAYFAHTLGVPEAKMASIPVGCNEDLFYPRPQTQVEGVCKVLYYSTYLPLHGVEAVVRAADILKEENEIRFKIIGRGQETPRIRQLADELGLRNVTFIDPVPLDALPGEIAAADICLGGHFGSSAKAGRVVPGKIYQILAMGRPLIAADTPANRDLLCQGESAWLCTPADPRALAEAILRLQRDPALRARLAQGGRALYLERCSEAVIAAQLEGIVKGMLAGEAG